MIGIQINGTAGRFSRGQALVGRLDSMVDGVSNEMHERLGQGVEDALIEIRILT